MALRDSRQSPARAWGSRRDVVFEVGSLQFSRIFATSRNIAQGVTCVCSLDWLVAALPAKFGSCTPQITGNVGGNKAQGSQIAITGHLRFGTRLRVGEHFAMCSVHAFGSSRPPGFEGSSRSKKFDTWPLHIISVYHWWLSSHQIEAPKDGHDYQNDHRWAVDSVSSWQV